MSVPLSPRSLLVAFSFVRPPSYLLGAVLPARTCGVPEDSLVPRLYGRILTMSVPLSPRSLLVAFSFVRPPSYLLGAVLPARTCGVPEDSLVPRLYGRILTMSVPLSPRSLHIAGSLVRPPSYLFFLRMSDLHACLSTPVRTCDVPDDSAIESTVVACCFLVCPTSFHMRLSWLVAVSPVRTCDVPEDSLVPRLYGCILTMSVPLSPRSLLVAISRVRPPSCLLVTVLPARSCDVPEDLMVPRFHERILTMSVPSSPRLFILWLACTSSISACPRLSVLHARSTPVTVSRIRSPAYLLVFTASHLWQT
ncbi:hypothetical protein DEU56DRAFT_920560 [Suillus clintonianus]|uniref:uncharacterized protein n=1 Tax=Suillus clintonianus TaxID=1904413 RepID=UPI001B87CB9F|nr:uncharacterized protein DEU56DRAFT_920560 [Suillus clintonianus]KAG2107609.1 hypothetical protein DEU56DRAFT_920560 [Suillus clintonianus]